MPSNSKDISPCVGCRDHFYNGNNDLGISECVHLASAKLVRRWRIGWWIDPTAPGAFTEVETYQCHRAPGQYALQEKLPDFAVDAVPLSLPPTPPHE